VVLRNRQMRVARITPAIDDYFFGASPGELIDPPPVWNATIVG
jgi:hypothetical protein